MSKIDVFTLGETMVLFQPEQMAPLEYVHSFPKLIGGAESNVAIGLQRLGHSVGWFSKLGDDPFGRYILRSIRGEGVDASTCLVTAQAPTGIFFKERRSAELVSVYYYRQGSAASLMEPEDLDVEYMSQAKILHITGITPALSDSCYRTVLSAIEIAKQTGQHIVFEPNLRLKLWRDQGRAKEVLLELAGYADVILPGLDEGQFMTGLETEREIAQALRGESQKTVIVKLGSQGAYYQSKDDQGYVAGFPVKQVVDPVGAGDGFAAGIIHGLLQGEPLPMSIKRANAIGAIVVGMNGDVVGLPTLAEVESYMSSAVGARDVLR